MILFIDTTKNDLIILKIKNKKDVLFEKKIKAHNSQTEKLLPLLKELLDEKKIRIEDVSKIIVNNTGDKFTSLRVGVLTANALAYALQIPVENFFQKNLKYNNFYLADVDYLSEPNITMSNKLNI